MPAAPLPGPDLATRLSRARFRAWHRGTREADYMIGGFFDRYHAQWDEAALAWFEAILDEDEADVLAWALGAGEAPERFRGPQLDAMRKLDYVNI
jgi:antitoxin CptB